MFVGSDQDTVDRIMQEDSRHDTSSKVGSFDCRSAWAVGGTISGAIGTFAALSI